MEDKGVVSHRSEGRQFVYRATVSEDEVRSSMVGELLDRLFAGDPAALVSHLVADHGMSEAELEELRVLLAAAEAGEENIR
jgi:predicted transcriptional regulator